MAIFSTFFFLGNIGQENVFYNILERKNALLGYKNKKYQKLEKLIFVPKGLTHGFEPKIAIFPTLLLKQYRPGKCSFTDILERKDAFLGYEIQEVQEVEQLTFFQRG